MQALAGCTRGLHLKSARPETQPIGCVLLHNKGGNSSARLADPRDSRGNVSWRRDAVSHVSVTSSWGLSNPWKSARKFERRCTGLPRRFTWNVCVNCLRGLAGVGGAKRGNWTVAAGLRARAWKTEYGLQVVSHPHFHC